MINFCSSKGVFCTSATDYGYCCATACMKKPDYEEVLSSGVAKIIGSDGREYVPIVRCKECKWFDGKGCEFLSVYRSDMDNWFCADGEKEKHE